METLAAAQPLTSLQREFAAVNFAVAYIGQATTVLAPQTQQWIGGVEETAPSVDMQQMPSSLRPGYQPSATAAVERSPVRPDAASVGAAHGAAQAAPFVSAAAASAGAAAAASRSAIMPPLQFDLFVKRGEAIEIPGKLAEIVLANLPDSLQHDTVVHLLLVLGLGQPQWTHHWSASMHLRPGHRRAAEPTASPWYIPPTQWSDHVLKAPGGAALFPGGFGRLLITVWCAPKSFDGLLLGMV